MRQCGSPLGTAREGMHSTGDLTFLLTARLFRRTWASLQNRRTLHTNDEHSLTILDKHDGHSTESIYRVMYNERWARIARRAVFEDSKFVGR